MKPDQLIKRRGKLGLIHVNATAEQAREWIAERMGKEIKVNWMKCSEWNEWNEWMKWEEGNTRDPDQWSFWKVLDSVSFKMVSVCRGEIKPLCISFWVASGIRHFQLCLSLYFKTSLCAKSLLWISVFIHVEITTNNITVIFI